MKIRPAIKADMDQITAIYKHYVLCHTATFETEPPDISEMIRRHDEIAAKGLPWAVAESNGEIRGYAYAGPYRSRPAYRFSVEDSIYIHPDFQRRGLGKNLLTTLIADCRRCGVRQIVAVIGDSANTASIRLHEIEGFRHVGVLTDVGFKFGRWIDTVMMQLPLD